MVLAAEWGHGRRRGWLRFARVKGYRPDKRAAEAATIETVRTIFAAQQGASTGAAPG